MCLNPNDCGFTCSRDRKFPSSHCYKIRQVWDNLSAVSSEHLRKAWLSWAADYWKMLTLCYWDFFIHWRLQLRKHLRFKSEWNVNVSEAATIEPWFFLWVQKFDLPKILGSIIIVPQNFVKLSNSWNSSIHNIFLMGHSQT